MGLNPVLDSTRFLVENPHHVFIDSEALERYAKAIYGEDMKIPKWDEPVFIDGIDKTAIDFFMVGNSINFFYNNPGARNKDDEKYRCAPYNGIPWSGAFGMFASLKRARNEGIPILEGEYLADMSKEDASDIFRGNIEIPMLDERVKILNDVGEVLCDFYDGHFHTLVEESDHMIFSDNLDGIAQRLVLDFKSFDDGVNYNGKWVAFNKRAQLAPAMLYGKFENQNPFHVSDIESLTVFADYNLPKVLRDREVLVYGDRLSSIVDNRQFIDHGSVEELEIRASTIHACDEIIKKVNEYRGGNPINALHLDYKLFNEGRNIKDGKPHHLTRTIAY
jgi:hypothetical protein